MPPLAAETANLLVTAPSLSVGSRPGTGLGWAGWAGTVDWDGLGIYSYNT